MKKELQGKQKGLFDRHLPNEYGWEKPNLPDLSRHQYIGFDTETTGLSIWKGARPIGLSLATLDGKKYYLPWGHEAGSQFSKAEVLDWAKRELKNKVIVGHNLKFDLLQMWAEGVDLREGNNIFQDTCLMGTLLDEHGWHSLDALSKEFLGAEKVVMKGIDKSRMADYPSHTIAEYAEKDADLTLQLYEAMKPELEKQDLLRVHQLESRVLPAVVEMETNGLYVDRQTLYEWRDAVHVEHKASMRELKYIDVNSSVQLEFYYKKMGWPYWMNFECEACGLIFPGPEIIDECEKCQSPQLKKRSPHFGEMFLSRDKSPLGKQIMHARKLDKLLNSYLTPWAHCIKGDNILRFELNQLRRSEGVGDQRGTITGRFSCNHVFEGSHPQQIWNQEKQEKIMGDQYLLRKLFIARPGMHKFQSDASQIEFRLFGHFSKAPRILEAYEKDPTTDFHELVKREVLNNLITRKEAKNINFGKIYGMGLLTFCRSMGVSLAEGAEMLSTYDALFPEASKLLKSASAVARRQGYVRTLYGRRGRFREEEGTHKALNKIIQGTAGDIMKERIAAIYEQIPRKDFISEVIVHDEVLGDIAQKKTAKRIQEVLENFSIPLKVPLLWDMNVGKSWAMCA